MLGVIGVRVRLPRPVAEAVEKDKGLALGFARLGTPSVSMAKGRFRNGDSGAFD